MVQYPKGSFYTEDGINCVDGFTTIPSQENASGYPKGTFFTENGVHYIAGAELTEYEGEVLDSPFVE